MAALNPAHPGPAAPPSDPAGPPATPRAGRSAVPARGRKSLPLVGILASLALLTGGGYVVYDRLVSPPAVAPSIATAEVVVGDITASVTATGNVATPAQANVGFLSAGQLVELLVKVGDTVAAGQPLARIDDTSLRLALAQAQAGYDAAMATLQKTLAGAPAEEIAAAQAQVEAAQISLAQAQAVPQGGDMAAAQSQLASAQSQLEKLRNPSAGDVAAAQAQLAAATAKLEALHNPRAEDVAVAQSQLVQAQLQLQALQNPRAEDVKSAELTLASAQATLDALRHPRAEDVAAAQAQLDQAKTSLAQLTDMPPVSQQEIANAELQVTSAQVAYDKALADASLVGKSGGPATAAAADAAIQQALITLQTAQNNLTALRQQAPSDWEIRNAQLAVQTAQANLDKVKNPPAAEVQQAQLAVEQARAALEKIRQPSAVDLQTAQEAVSQAQLNLDKLLSPSVADVATAQQAVVSAQSALAALTNPDPYSIAAAEQAVVQAQAAIDKLLAGNAYDVQSAQNAVTQAQIGLAQVQAGSTSYEIAAAQASLDQARASLDQARANLAAATLTAPISGVVAATGASLGEQVGSSTAVVTLVDTQQLRVDVVVDETDIAMIEVGQQATVAFEALSGQSLPGTVSVISPLATTTNGVVTYAVQIALDPLPAQAAGVRAGMTATATIVTDSREGVMLAPNRAIRTQGQAKTVQVLTAEGTTETRQVQVGLAGDQTSEILSGLQPGDRVVVAGTTTTTAGTGPGGASVGLPAMGVGPGMAGAPARPG